jgi:hypothetical protein
MKHLLSRSLFAFLALLLSTLMLAGCSNTYSRDDFNTGVIGKSEQEVTQKFGKPESVKAEGDEAVVWTYSHVTFDLANQNRIDSKAVVTFQGPTGARHATRVDFS